MIKAADLLRDYPASVDAGDLIWRYGAHVPQVGSMTLAAGVEVVIPGEVAAS